MIICDLGKCTGCCACYNACKKNAITLKINSKGFYFPAIDEVKCVNCGLCKKVCPTLNSPGGNEHKSVFAALVKDDDERAKSTSGGIYACLAKTIIKYGGYVYGAAMDDELVVRHIEAHSIEDLEKTRNSKYVQSDIGFCYKQAQKRLNEGYQVLFSGTPCQIAGLRSFLRKEYSNLLTVDILCHGVPSPGLLRKYIKNEEIQAGAKLVDLQFRSKDIGWKKPNTVRKFDSNQKIGSGDTFVPGFLKNLYLRESCYSCQYATDKRQGDITLGDFWGYQESAPEYIEDDDKGISLVIVNTSKGEKAFKSIKRYISTAKRTMDDAKRGNPVLYKPCDKPDGYDEFWNDASNMGWDELANKYIKPQDSEDWMNKELRDYYDIPFEKRHRKHYIRLKLGMVYRKLKRIGGK